MEAAMTRELQIATNDKLNLPVDFVTERIAFLARTGAGKSGGMRVLAEQMLEADQFIIFLDPKGDAWGIRSDYSVLIMGGEHADVPLEATAGKFVADFLVRERISTVLDVSEFSEADMVRFTGEFADRFYRTNRDAVHFFIDEADEFAPQSGYNQAALKCLGAIQRIQRRGRGRGIGVTLATQRSAVINKSVLTQAGTLIAMQTTAPHDLKAVDAWLEHTATKDARREIMEALPALKPREAFVYSPQFLGTKPHRIVFRAFKSFDSMRTPKHGETRQQPKKLADIDLSAVQRDMASTIEEAKQNDPGELKKQITELSKKLKAGVPDERAIHVAVSERDKHWQGEIAKMRRAHDSLAERLTKILELATLNEAPKVKMISDVWTPPKIRTEAFSESELLKPHKLILQAFYWIRDEEITAAKIAFYSGYSSTSSSFSNAVGRLRTLGLVSGWKLTDAGETLASSFSTSRPTGAELREWLRPKLQKAENVILDVLISASGRCLDSEEIAEQSGYSITSSSFANAIGKLRTIKAAEGSARNGGIRASGVFLEDALC